MIRRLAIDTVKQFAGSVPDEVLDIALAAVDLSYAASDAAKLKAARRMLRHFYGVDIDLTQFTKAAAEEATEEAGASRGSVRTTRIDRLLPAASSVEEP